MPDENFAPKTDVSLITGSLRQLGTTNDVTPCTADSGQQLQLRNENKELVLAGAADAGTRVLLIPRLYFFFVSRLYRHFLPVYRGVSLAKVMAGS